MKKDGSPMPTWLRREWRQRAGVPLPADVPAREPGEDDPELPDAPPDEEPPGSLDDLDPDDIPF
jgi:hypothetical protein